MTTVFPPNGINFSLQPSTENTCEVKVIIPKETKDRERRVSLSPDVAASLVKAGFECLVEKTQGSNPILRIRFMKAGAKLSATTKNYTARQILSSKVNAPSVEEVSWMKKTLC